MYCDPIALSPGAFVIRLERRGGRVAVKRERERGAELRKEELAAGAAEDVKQEVITKRKKKSRCGGQR